MLVEATADTAVFETRVAMIILAELGSLSDSGVSGVWGVVGRTLSTVAALMEDEAALVETLAFFWMSSVTVNRCEGTEPHTAFLANGVEY